MKDPNQYKPAEINELGMAGDTIQGIKEIIAMESIAGDPDFMHRPEAFAHFDE